MVTPIDESSLKALGIARLPVPVPFVEAGGPVNVFSLENEDGSLTLFDSGLGTPEGLAALQSGAVEQGVDLSRVTRLIVSHGHIDHYGNTQALAERTGASVWVHPADRAKIEGDGRFAAQLEQGFDYFLKLGLPRELLEAMLAGARKVRPFARPVEPHRVQLLEDGQLFRFARFTARVLHCPGHTPGLVCLWAAGPGLLVADDHVLARVSPNPLIDLSQGQGATKFRALERYVESAQRVMALPVHAVLPGHGECFSGHVELLGSLLRFYGTRQQKLLAALPAEGATVYGLLEVLFARRDVSRLSLMLSEVLANLEVLETGGAVQREERDGVYRFSRAAAPG
jgi:glyoxylase-like metal-dependent hydrolase (beta-lactamase superfamily II)